MRRRTVILQILVAGALSLQPALATDLPTLTLSAGSTTVVYDRDALEAMPQTEINTTSPWTEGVVHYEGVALSHLLEVSAADGAMAIVTALNDYSVDIPTSDFAEFGPILAIKRDGEYMPVSDKGPFFIVYPFDENPELRQQPYHGRAVWQVKAIAIP
ncbi:oxidoreductase [Devosia sp. MC532]|uniref:oxidoreductase n=1 Tax=Devosia sp. MC532 TaxID=2799788 RepID=UPI0018F42EA2|nr:oxidoreductase [Devosia sp. MC532]MBJ7578935.1 oxidoreductase [Devosia sp. MC532]